MYKINSVNIEQYNIIPGIAPGEGISMKGCFDLPKRIGTTHKSWDEENTIEPYVDADEMFFDVRNIEFHGIIDGAKTFVKNKIEELKAAINGFGELFLFESPYGNFSVYVRDISVKHYDSLTTIIMFMVEPEVGIIASPIDQPTIYQSAEYSETAIKNDCANGFDGSEVTLTSIAGQFTSTLSQEAANQLAINWVRENKQDYANLNGSCTPSPVTFWNTRQIATLQKDDCGGGYIGSVVQYVVEPFKYSSQISQADANLKAINEISANFNQQYANDNGTCNLLNLFYQTSNETGVFTTTYSTNKIRIQTFYVENSAPVGTKFIVTIYGVEVVYESLLNDNRDDIINGLVNVINAVTEAEWSSKDRAPSFGGNVKKPFAEKTEPGFLNLFPQFFIPELRIQMDALDSSEIATIRFEIV